MTKSMYYVAAALVACLVLTTTTSEAKGLKNKGTPGTKRSTTDPKDQVTLEIAGPTDSQAAAAFQKALETSGLQAKIHESKKGGKPLKVMAAVDKTADLGPWSKAVMTAVPTKPGQTPPALEVMVYAPLTKENSSQAMVQLERIKGVDAKHSSFDVKKGEMRVRISGAEHVTAEDILKGVQEAGVVPTLTKEAHAKKT